MSKNNKNKKINSYSSDSDEMTRMFKVLGTVVIIFVAFYFIFAVVSGEISFSSKKKKVEIQNVEILAGNSFSRQEASYYVLMFDFDKGDADIYSGIYSLYESYYKVDKLYVVDLSKKFNSKYVVEDASLVDISSIEPLKVVNGTLIKVEDGKGVSKFTTVDTIKSELFTTN